MLIQVVLLFLSIVYIFIILTTIISENNLTILSISWISFIGYLGVLIGYVSYPKIVQEESRIKILGDRRKTIRGVLKAAEGTKNYRLNNGYVPELDPETGKPIKSDAQSAFTLTAFVVSGGAV